MNQKVNVYGKVLQKKVFALKFYKIFIVNNLKKLIVLEMKQKQRLEDVFGVKIYNFVYGITKLILVLVEQWNHVIKV